MLQRELGDLRSSGTGERIILQHDGAGTASRGRTKGVVEVSRGSNLDLLNLNPQRPAGGFERPQRRWRSGVGGEQEDRRSGQAGKQLLQQPHPLPEELGRQARESSYVSARASQARRKAVFDRIAAGAADNGNLSGR